MDTGFGAIPIYDYLLGEDFEVWVMRNRSHDPLTLRVIQYWLEQDYSQVDEV